MCLPRCAGLHLVAVDRHRVEERQGGQPVRPEPAGHQPAGQGPEGRRLPPADLGRAGEAREAGSAALSAECCAPMIVLWFPITEPLASCLAADV